jgi:small subunit ribosomal protein S3
MEAGALGAEIVISGKLTTERARFEKFKAGHFPIVGEPALRAMKTAEAHVQLKPGIIGVRVKIMPPDAYFPDKVSIMEPAPEEEQATAPPTPAPATTPAPAPAKEEEAEAEPEPEVQAKEVADEPKPEPTPEETKE